MKILAFDTATEACTVALWCDGAVHERMELGQRHAEKLLALVDHVLAEGGVALGDLDAIAFGRGPGSFTGLRISAGVAQGLAFGAGVPVVPISSLAAIAAAAQAPRVLAAIDARMQQVYWGAYILAADGRMDLLGEEIVVDPANVPVPPHAEWIGAGSGWDQYAVVLQTRLGAACARWQPHGYPSARFIAALSALDVRAGRVLAPEQALPVYIRDNVAVKKTPMG